MSRAGSNVPHSSDHVVRPALAPDGATARHLSCPRCGLTITPKVPWLTIDHCPRCVARAHTIVELFSSQRPADQRYADDRPLTSHERRLDRR